ncbi:hypothetical protein GCM10009798_33450 [Nocardioides panacihumi]|uniref:NAD(P)-binding domain-containing protein n=1 Tax=Nocardioides panacihumi TaxID=400774 RepID=A0ABN2RJ90_9ACTN
MILVAGGSGLLGRKVVQLLDANGEDVRVLSRDPARAAGLPAGAQVVTGDLRRGRLDAVVGGCSCVISVVHGFTGPTRTSPAAVDKGGNSRLIAAATRAGVERFVLGSVVGAGPHHPMSLHRMKYAAEQELHNSGLTGVTVRATPFMQTWLDLIGAKVAAGGPALVMGPGTNPINFVSADDVATFICLAALGDPRIGTEITVGGPDDLSFLDLAQHLLTLRGRSDSPRHVPLSALKALAALARPINPDLARKAKAAVVMNTTDMTLDASPSRRRFPEVAASTLADVTRSTHSAHPR